MYICTTTQQVHSTPKSCDICTYNSGMWLVCSFKGRLQRYLLRNYYQCCFSTVHEGGREHGLLTISVVFSTVHKVGGEQGVFTNHQYVLSQVHNYTTQPQQYYRHIPLPPSIHSTTGRHLYYPASTSTTQHPQYYRQTPLLSSLHLYHPTSTVLQADTSTIQPPPLPPSIHSTTGRYLYYPASTCTTQPPPLLPSLHLYHPASTVLQAHTSTTQHPQYYRQTPLLPSLHLYYPPSTVLQADTSTTQSHIEQRCTEHDCRVYTYLENGCHGAENWSQNGGRLFEVLRDNKKSSTSRQSQEHLQHTTLHFTEG